MGSPEKQPINLPGSSVPVEPLTPTSTAGIVPGAETQRDRPYLSDRRRCFTWARRVARCRSATVHRASCAVGSRRSGTPGRYSPRHCRHLRGTTRSIPLTTTGNPQCGQCVYNGVMFRPPKPVNRPADGSAMPRMVLRKAKTSYQLRVTSYQSNLSIPQPMFVTGNW